ncbi:MAG: hypothetical protein B6I18_00315 [Bacteroidetes bacterium 4572_112]|nr:MAG: hypothetical protein B6I18_00315 [Bacteroidetes bacterium 4572_112]
MNKKILTPIPLYGFDPSEVAIPWIQIMKNNIEVVFATLSDKKATADNIMLTGKKLGFWKFILQARKDAVDAYYELEKNESFCNPIKYVDAQELNFDAVLLPGGHDKGVKGYLESKVLILKQKNQ